MSEGAGTKRGPQNLSCQKQMTLAFGLLELKNSFRTRHPLLIHLDAERTLFRRLK